LGLKKQTRVNIIWVIVSQLDSFDSYEDIFTAARNIGLELVFVTAKKNTPLGRLSNMGIEASDSEYVLLNDDDDSLRCDFFRDAIDLLDDKEYLGVAGQAAIIHEDCRRPHLHTVLAAGKTPISKQMLKQRNLIVTNAFIFRRQAFILSGGYPEDVSVAEDWLFYLKILDFGKIQYFPRICANVYLRLGSDQSSLNSNTDRMEHQAMSQIISSHYESEPLGNVTIYRSRLWRLIDRITFRFSGYLFPRK